MLSPQAVSRTSGQLAPVGPHTGFFAVAGASYAKPEPLCFEAVCTVHVIQEHKTVGLLRDPTQERRAICLQKLDYFVFVDRQQHRRDSSYENKTAQPEGETQMRLSLTGQ